MERKLVLLEGDQPLPAERPQHGGQGGAVHGEVVGQLLPVKGDGEGAAPLPTALVRQIGQSFLPGGGQGEVAQLPVEGKVFPGQHQLKPLPQLGERLELVLARKNLALHRKLGYLTLPTTREKALAYLSDESRRQGSGTFSIPFDRQELADYLSVDRSALSAVLGALRREGLISFQKNQFTLHRQEDLR